MKIFMAVIVILISASGTKAADIQSCLSAIKAYGNSLGQRSNLNPIIMPSIFMYVTDLNGAAGSYDSQIPGSKSDFAGCESFGLSRATIQTVVSFETEPRSEIVFDSLAQCYAATIYLAPKIEGMLGHSEASKLGANFGKAMADAQILISRTLKLPNLTRSLIGEEAKKRVAAHPGADALDEWIRGCDRIGIDLRSVVTKLKNAGHL